jgi:hypothetical protein
MKKIILLSFITILLFLFSSFIVKTNKIFAAEDEVKVDCSARVEGSHIIVNVDNVEEKISEQNIKSLYIGIEEKTFGVGKLVFKYEITESKEYSFLIKSDKWQAGDYTLVIHERDGKNGPVNHSYCEYDFTIPGYLLTSPEEIETSNESLCHGNNSCLNCLRGGGSWTALGCIQIKDPSAMTKWVLEFAIGIAGGIAFLLMIFGGFQIILSGGNPDKIKAGKEIIVAALSGLLLIIFSVLILRIIGYDILGLPGFGK